MSNVTVWRTFVRGLRKGNGKEKNGGDNNFCKFLKFSNIFKYPNKLKKLLHVLAIMIVINLCS